MGKIEYLLAPVITQSMVPPRRKKSEHSLDILRGKCPTTTPFVIATEYRSAAFRGSLSHCTTSPIAGSHISLHIWCPRMHDSLRSSSMIVHVLVNNNNIFLCLEIIGVFNFRTDARIRKFLEAKISYPKIFGHENFRIYGSWFLSWLKPVVHAGGRMASHQ